MSKCVICGKNIMKDEETFDYGFGLEHKTCTKKNSEILDKKVKYCDKKQSKETLKQTAFMNIIRKRLAEQVNGEETFGYITKYGRILHNLEKNHINDAFVIAKGTIQKRVNPYQVTQTRRNNRCLQINRNGYRPSIRRQRYKLQPNDLVKYDGKIQIVKCMFNYGKWIGLGNGINTNIKNVELVTYGKGIQFR